MIQYYGFISGLYGLLMFSTTSELLQFALSPSSTYCQRSASITPNTPSLPLCYWNICNNTPVTLQFNSCFVTSSQESHSLLQYNELISLPLYFTNKIPLLFILKPAPKLESTCYISDKELDYRLPTSHNLKGV